METRFEIMHLIITFSELQWKVMTWAKEYTRQVLSDLGADHEWITSTSSMCWYQWWWWRRGHNKMVKLVWELLKKVMNVCWICCYCCQLEDGSGWVVKWRRTARTSCLHHLTHHVTVILIAILMQLISFQFGILTSTPTVGLKRYLNKNKCPHVSRNRQIAFTINF